MWVLTIARNLSKLFINKLIFCLQETTYIWFFYIEIVCLKQKKTKKLGNGQALKLIPA